MLEPSGISWGSVSQKIAVSGEGIPCQKRTGKGPRRAWCLGYQLDLLTRCAESDQWVACVKGGRGPNADTWNIYQSAGQGASCTYPTKALHADGVVSAK
ncbi:hypothetical protein D3C77_592680 [compost metagenome]